MKRNTPIIYVLITLFILSIFPYDVLAHNGARDELGGHFRKSDCMYFLHNPTELAKTAKNMEALIELIQQKNSNSSCTEELSKNKVDLEGFSFSTEQSVVTASPPTLQIGTTYSAKLDRCIDGDTAVFTVNGTSYTTRFLYIDTPESTNQKEAYGKEASDFTCSFLQKGNITLEPDGTTPFDKYDRLLAWVFVDGKLHQEEISKAGLVEDFYDYGTYKYEDQVKNAMSEARANLVGMYSTNESVTEVNSTQAPPISNQQTEESDTIPVSERKSTTGLGIFALGTVFLFFVFPSISKKWGVKPLIVHRLWTKNLWVNALVLFPLYTTLFFIVLIVIVIELIHLVFKKVK